ncbi:unnamed protein product [Nesidiocoris tenuis]|uniref:C2H2-type domain-containing protein n=1 Tax=Nesidiocoris tenuis TaxID=355587 RepID=A0A6H5FXU7_9HEMI|nr:unnamed protein product [Nesidiocoris tenuis]
MICLRSFATKGSLKLHTTTCKKSAEQKFSCASCGKVFSKKIHLNSHMRFSHPDIDVDPRFKYKCPNCPQRYMTEDELLVDHAKEGCITPGDVCDLCGEIYYIRGGLEAHMKAAHSQTVHSTQQKYACFNSSSRNTPASTATAKIRLLHQQQRKYACFNSSSRNTPASAAAAAEIRLLQQQQQKYACFNSSGSNTLASTAAAVISCLQQQLQKYTCSNSSSGNTPASTAAAGIRLIQPQRQ